MRRSSIGLEAKALAELYFPLPAGEAHMNSKCVLYGAVLIVAWYVTNALSAYYSKSVFVIAESTAEDDHLFHLSLLVSFAQRGVRCGWLLLPPSLLYKYGVPLDLLC